MAENLSDNVKFNYIERGLIFNANCDRANRNCRGRAVQSPKALEGSGIIQNINRYRSLQDSESAL
ncbi:hypothetical protein [Oscillatoria sp. FACHB-1406]|uniref:hypothetical protein n=1 Tax=Oscillatoria sp. FACHB-1406 TaxID=2692846 RepID=UPI001684ACF5|nr:hypothetical protein [Oscillatoria sp. FACHB-1406]MBD2578550.1 hypothetical protein [Oscillatoria sp. FACHB-1406]